jgi:hypothetical protein
MIEEITYKTCSKCGEEKPLTTEYFAKDKKNKSGLSYRCKLCANIHAKEYRENNLEKAKSSNLLSQKLNRKKRTEQQRRWRQNNKEKSLQYSKKYQSKNLNKMKKYRNEYVKNRYKTDIFYRINVLLRGSLFRALDKKDFNTIKYIGCDIKTFIKHIESQFTEGMTWENQGRQENTMGWELDHITPISTAQTKEDIFKLYHYTNFQPLWKEDNLRKSNKISEEYGNI